MRSITVITNQKNHQLFDQLQKILVAQSTETVDERTNQILVSLEQNPEAVFDALSEEVEFSTQGKTNGFYALLYFIEITQYHAVQQKKLLEILKKLIATDAVGVTRGLFSVPIDTSVEFDFFRGNGFYRLMVVIRTLIEGSFQYISIASDIIEPLLAADAECVFTGLLQSNDRHENGFCVLAGSILSAVVQSHYVAIETLVGILKCLVKKDSIRVAKELAKANNKTGLNDLFKAFRFAEDTRKNTLSLMLIEILKDIIVANPSGAVEALLKKDLFGTSRFYYLAAARNIQESEKKSQFLDNIFEALITENHSIVFNQLLYRDNTELTLCQLAFDIYLHASALPGQDEYALQSINVLFYLAKTDSEKLIQKLSDQDKKGYYGFYYLAKSLVSALNSRNEKQISLITNILQWLSQRNREAVVLALSQKAALEDLEEKSGFDLLACMLYKFYSKELFFYFYDSRDALIFGPKYLLILLIEWNEFSYHIPKQFKAVLIDFRKELCDTLLAMAKEKEIIENETEALSLLTKVIAPNTLLQGVFKERMTAKFWKESPIQRIQAEIDRLTSKKEKELAPLSTLLISDNDAQEQKTGLRQRKNVN